MKRGKMPRNKFFSVVPNLLPHSDLRYQKWLTSLKKRPPPWSKGKTKETDTGVRKVSDTFKREGIDNFAIWRDKARKSGIIPASYPAFKRSNDLACLIGIVLGDGHIDEFPRTEKLSIALGTDKPKLITFTVELIQKVFNKTPSIYKPKNINMVKVNIYQKYISKRLSVPSGNRRYAKKGIPGWVWSKKSYLISCLRGLYESDGYLSIHLPTCTYNFAFVNMNGKLLFDVKTALISLGYHPEVRPTTIRLRKRHEVKSFEKLSSFRNYDAG